MTRLSRQMALSLVEMQAAEGLVMLCLPMHSSSSDMSRLNEDTLAPLPQTFLLVARRNRSFILTIRKKSLSL